MDDIQLHTEPKIMNVKEVWSFIADHLGKSYLRVYQWGSGEGFTIELDDEGMGEKNQRLELTWSQFDAIKACVEAITNAP